MRSDDERLGQLLRAIRRRSGHTQADLALVAGVPRRHVIAVEAGRAGEVELHRLRRLFAAVDARLKATVWWRGAAADRLLDERHAALTELGVAVFARRGWQTAVEVTFSKVGERAPSTSSASTQRRGRLWRPRSRVPSAHSKRPIERSTSRSGWRQGWSSNGSARDHRPYRAC